MLPPCGPSCHNMPMLRWQTVQASCHSLADQRTECLDNDHNVECGQRLQSKSADTFESCTGTAVHGLIILIEYSRLSGNSRDRPVDSRQAYSMRYCSNQPEIHTHHEDQQLRGNLSGSFNPFILCLLRATCICCVSMQALFIFH